MLSREESDDKWKAKAISGGKHRLGSTRSSRGRRSTRHAMQGAAMRSHRVLDDHDDTSPGKRGMAAAGAPTPLVSSTAAVAHHPRMMRTPSGTGGVTSTRTAMSGFPHVAHQASLTGIGTGIGTGSEFFGAGTPKSTAAGAHSRALSGATEMSDYTTVSGLTGISGVSTPMSAAMASPSTRASRLFQGTPLAPDFMRQFSDVSAAAGTPVVGSGATPRDWRSISFEGAGGAGGPGTPSTKRALSRDSVSAAAHRHHHARVSSLASLVSIDNMSQFDSPRRQSSLDWTQWVINPETDLSRLDPEQFAKQMKADDFRADAEARRELAQRREYGVIEKAAKRGGKRRRQQQQQQQKREVLVSSSSKRARSREEWRPGTHVMVRKRPDSYQWFNGHINHIDSKGDIQVQFYDDCLHRMFTRRFDQDSADVMLPREILIEHMTKQKHDSIRGGIGKVGKEDFMAMLSKKKEVVAKEELPPAKGLEQMADAAKKLSKLKKKKTLKGGGEDGDDEDAEGDGKKGKKKKKKKKGKKEKEKDKKKKDKKDKKKEKDKKKKKGKSGDGDAKDKKKKKKDAGKKTKKKSKK